MSDLFYKIDKNSKNQYKIKTNYCNREKLIHHDWKRMIDATIVVYDVLVCKKALE